MGVFGVLVEVVLVAGPVLAAIVFHEVAHGWVAYAFGDPTAAERGRLTLNPLAHIDPFGTVILPGLLLLAPLIFGHRMPVFGYARPVPVNFGRLRHPRRDTILVALAGPATNLAMAAVAALVLARVPAAEDALLPALVRLVAMATIQVNCLLAVFNALPIPPLDGGRVLVALLPVKTARALMTLDRLGYIIVLLLLFNTDVVARLVGPVTAFFFRLGG